MQVLEGAQYRLRVKLTNEAGEQLPPELFRVYAGAFCPGYAPAHFHAERTADEWVLTMPGLKPGRVPWNWQVIAAEYATGVEWLLAAGEVNVTPRHATGSGCVDPGELKIVATLDKTTLQMTVQIGESTAACSLAVVAAQNSAKAADTSAKAAANSARDAAEQAQDAETARKLADGSAKNAAASADDAHEQATAADASATDAANSASAAANEVTKAAAEAEKAKLERESAAAYATEAAQNAQEAMDNKQGAEQAAQDAAQAQTAARLHEKNAAAASQNATQKATEATASAAQAAADKAAAKQAKQDALAAQTKAEQEATRAETAQAKATEEAAGVAEVAWARGFPVVEWQMDAPDEVQLDQLAAFWCMKNVAVLCKGQCADFQPRNVLNTAFGLMGAAAWVNIVFNVEQRFRNLDGFSKLAPSIENCFYMAPGNGNNGMFDFANALYYKADIKYSNWGGFTGGQCKAFEHSSDAPMDTQYFDMKVNGNISRSYTNLGTRVRQICKSVDGALQHVKVPAGTWEQAVDAQHAFSGAFALPERYIPDALPSLQDGTGMFSGCRLSAGKAVSILSSLQPAPEGAAYKLTVGIHIDHQTDAEVWAAIAAAEGKGWKLNIQWTPGGPTYTTPGVSTMAMGTLIYAKVNETDRPDGTTERVLDWGHYVTKWEDRGYEQFRSLESAYRYFGLDAQEEALTNN